MNPRYPLTHRSMHVISTLTRLPSGDSLTDTLITERTYPLSSPLTTGTYKDPSGCHPLYSTDLSIVPIRHMLERSINMGFLDYLLDMYTRPVYPLSVGLLVLGVHGCYVSRIGYCIRAAIVNTTGEGLSLTKDFRGRIRLSPYPLLYL